MTTSHRRNNSRDTTSALTLTLRTAAREYVWLYDQRHGMSAQEIADRDHISLIRVRFGLARARATDGLSRETSSERSLRAPRLIPMFPIGFYSPQSTCPHGRLMRRGSLFCCMICHRSGIDGHPALQRSPASDPKPEPKPERVPKKQARETRKQKRERIYGIPQPAVHDCNQTSE